MDFHRKAVSLAAVSLSDPVGSGSIKELAESLLILLAIVLVVTLCDQFASHVCKPVFTRFRPTHHPDFMDQVKTVFGYREDFTDLFPAMLRTLSVSRLYGIDHAG